MPDYNTKGNWKELDYIKRAHNEVIKNHITFEEIDFFDEALSKEMIDFSAEWIKGKVIEDREIWFYSRKPIYSSEIDVRKFISRDPNGKLIGFAFYDPIYENGAIIGYSATINRTDIHHYKKLVVTLNMFAAQKFKEEGKYFLNLHLSPFDNIKYGKYNDDYLVKLFFNLSRNFGEKLYNFAGLSFIKSKYRGNTTYKYSASNRFFTISDIFSSYLKSGIIDGKLSTFFKSLIK